MNIKIIAIIASVCALFAAPSAAADKLTIEDAIKRGLKNNFQIRIARKDLDIARNNNSWGLAGRYPVIGLNLNSANSINNDPSQSRPGDRDKFNSYVLSPSVSLNWALFSGFRVQISKQKFELLEKMGAGAKEIVIENTVQAIVLAYYGIILEQEKMKITEELMTLSKDRYDYVLSRKELGLAITHDVLNAKIAYLSDKANHISQKMNVKNARRNLNLVLGETSEKLFIIEKSVDMVHIDASLSSLKKKLFNNNAHLKNQFVNQEILKKEIKLQRSGYYPTVSLNSGVSMNRLSLKYPDIPLSSQNSYDYYINFSVSLNLFNGGNTRRAIKNARISQKIGALKLDEMKLSLENRIAGLYELYHLQSELLVIAEENVKSAKLNLGISFEKYKVGAINSFNYRDVQILYLNTAIGKLQANYNLMDTGTELLRLTGELIGRYIKE